MKITSAQLYPFCLPLRRALVNAQGVVVERRGSLLRLAGDGGEVGWGEASPYPGFGLESLQESRLALATSARQLLGLKVVPGDELTARITALTVASPSARAALESAVLDLLARTLRRPMYELLTPETREKSARVECNALLSGDDLDALQRTARVQAASGYRTFKLKVGALGLQRDLARVASLREAVGPGAAIRLDANQSYETGEALSALEVFARYQIEYLEQPLAATALDAMAGLREKSPILLAADESVASEADALRVIDADAADVIVIKPSVVGGPSTSLRIARVAREAGLKLVVTSLLDSAVGVSAAQQVAIAIACEGELPACGLATGELLAADVAFSAPPIRGCLAIPSQPGLGIELEMSRVHGCRDGSVVELSR